MSVPLVEWHTLSLKVVFIKSIMSQTELKNGLKINRNTENHDINKNIS